MLKNNDKLLELVRSLQNQFQISVLWGSDVKTNPDEKEKGVVIGMTKYIRRGMTDFSYKSFSCEIGKKHERAVGDGAGSHLGFDKISTKYF